MKDEIIIHHLHSHKINYDQAIRLTGAKFIEIGLSDFLNDNDLKALINARTVAIFYVAKFEKCKDSFPLKKVLKLQKVLVSRSL